MVNLYYCQEGLFLAILLFFCLKLAKILNNFLKQKMRVFG